MAPDIHVYATETHFSLHFQLTLGMGSVQSLIGSLYIIMKLMLSFNCTHICSFLFPKFILLNESLFIE